MAIVFFPGKFQPPHIGHVISISKLLGNNHVIIGITEGPPRVMKREEVKEIFETIFRNSVEYHCIDGILTDHKTIENLPEFDILVSGNDEVIEWGINLGLTVRKIPRTEGLGCCGTELRKLNEKLKFKKIAPGTYSISKSKIPKLNLLEKKK